MKLLELFAGYGSQKMAWDELGVYVQSTISEIDKYAIQAYNQLHGETKNLGDICKIESVDYYDMWTYSFPCQDLSVAGRQAGIKEGTRSGLLFEVERLLEKSVSENTQPKYLLLENVKALVSKKFKPDFDRWLDKLNQLGYNNYWQVLNAKDYGIPQNRERVFVVSVRKDIDTNGYKFPEKQELKLRLKDILESNVDEKYYLSDDKVRSFENKPIKEREVAIISKQGTHIDRVTDIAGTLMARDYKGFGNQGMNGVVEPLIAASRGRYKDNGKTEQHCEVNTTGCSNTLTSVQKDNYVVEPSVIQVGNFMSSKKWDNPQCGRVYSQEGCSPTLNTCGGGNHEPKIVADYRIRKLTPRECWRLMGVPDEYFNKLHDISNTQLYKMAGNSIVVNVLKAIFKGLM